MDEKKRQLLRRRLHPSSPEPSHARPRPEPPSPRPDLRLDFWLGNAILLISLYVLLSAGQLMGLCEDC